MQAHTYTVTHTHVHAVFAQIKAVALRDLREIRQQRAYGNRRLCHRNTHHFPRETNYCCCRPAFADFLLLLLLLLFQSSALYPASSILRGPTHPPFPILLLCPCGKAVLAYVYILCQALCLESVLKVISHNKMRMRKWPICELFADLGL